MNCSTIPDTTLLTREQRAVAIAQDVLAHLDTTKFDQLTYISGRLPKEEVLALGLKEKWLTTDLQEIEPVVRKNCKVCLLGGLLMAKARLYDDVKIHDLFGDGFPSEFQEEFCLSSHYNDFSEALDDFDEEDLLMMEATFELQNVQDIDDELAAAAVAFGVRASQTAERNDTAERRARVFAVMKNVIENKGSFVPPPITLEDFFSEFSTAKLASLFNAESVYAIGRDEDEEDDEDLDYEEDEDDGDDEEDTELDHGKSEKAGV